MNNIDYLSLDGRSLRTLVTVLEESSNAYGLPEDEFLIVLQDVGESRHVSFQITTPITIIRDGPGKD